MDESSSSVSDSWSDHIRESSGRVSGLWVWSLVLVSGSGSHDWAFLLDKCLGIPGLAIGIREMEVRAKN